MRQRHAISPGFFGHYQDLGISSLKRHDSAVCNCILSVGRVIVIRVCCRIGSHEEAVSDAVCDFDLFFYFKILLVPGTMLLLKLTTQPNIATPGCTGVSNVTRARLLGASKVVLYS